MQDKPWLGFYQEMLEWRPRPLRAYKEGRFYLWTNSKSLKKELWIQADGRLRVRGVSV